MWHTVKVTNLEETEYFDLIKILSQSDQLAICHSSDQNEIVVVITHPNLQNIINTIKFCSEVYDNPEYEAC
jgi:hypothetical protein